MGFTGADLPVETWLTKPDAAKIAGIGTRQLERRGSTGMVRKFALERRPGQRAASVLYSREDCEALREGRAPAHAVHQPSPGEIMTASRKKRLTGGKTATARPWLSLIEA